MKVLPTLNIQNGRLAASSETDPQAVTAALLEQGCCRFAFVDEDAVANSGNNRTLISTLIRRVHQVQSKACIQVAGGIRSSDQAQFYVDQGVTWLVVGTVLHRYPMVADQLLARFRENCIAAIDACRGEVRAEATPPGMRAPALAQRIAEMGFKRIELMDILPFPEADPDYLTAHSVIEASRVPLFMGGSLRTPRHVQKAGEIRGIQGVFVPAQAVLDCPEMLQSMAHPCL